MAESIIKECSVVFKPCTPKLRECFVPLQQCTAPNSEVKKRNLRSRSRSPGLTAGVATVPSTPNTDPALATELRRAITEKNILTTKTKSKFILALNELEKANAETSRKQRKEKAIQEVIDSEIAYLKQLEIIVKYFKEPLKQRYILSENEIEKIFSKIAILYGLNKELLDIMNDNEISIAEAFKMVAPFFKMYSTYAYEYKMICGFLQELQSKNDEFSKFLSCQETRPEVNTKLSSLLIRPIQRIPRYCLLLKQILLYTSESEPDYRILKESLQTVEESAKHIDSLVEDRENSEKLLRIQHSLTNQSPQIIKPGRKLLKEGKVLNMTEAGGNIMYLVGMTDILMLCKIKKENLKSKNALKCSTILPLNKCRFSQNANLRKIHISCDNSDIEILIETVKEFHQWIDMLKESHKNIIINRYTLRKESSSRRPAFKEHVINYHEVGLSPGVPQRKRRISGMQPDLAKIATDGGENKRRNPPYVTLSKRRCIRDVSVEKTNNNINDSLFPLRHHYLPQTEAPSEHLQNNTNSEIVNRNVSNDNDVFVFGKPNNLDRGFNFKIMNFFACVGNSLRRLFRIK